MRSIAARNPLTGAKIDVPLPPQVGVGPYVQEGKWLFVLSGDRVWQITIAKPSEVRSSAVLESPGPPMTGTASTISVSGFGGKVRVPRGHEVSSCVKCVPEDRQCGVCRYVSRGRCDPVRVMNRMPAQGDTLTMRRAAASVTVGRQLNQGAQGVVYEATVGETLLALKWLRPGPHSASLKRSIAALTERPRPHKAFIWPIDLVDSTEIEGFGYVMPYMTSRFISFAQMLKNEPSFRVLIRIGRNLVDAFAALHASGHCYRDISFRNLYVDPVSAEVAICDNDNVGLDDGEVFVKGSNEFMAPEVLRDELFPCTATDLYSLAVFLFIVFVRGHPLEGVRTSSMYSWAEEHHMSTDELMRRNFGSEPLFVFDPADDSNRPHRATQCSRTGASTRSFSENYSRRPSRRGSERRRYRHT